MSLPKSTANFFNILENKITGGETTDSILKSYLYLEKEDIIEVLPYAAFIADEQVI